MSLPQVHHCKATNAQARVMPLLVACCDCAIYCLRTPSLYFGLSLLQVVVLICVTHHGGGNF